MTKRHDVLIIGGGPGGATAALLLARAGWAVALLERKQFPRRKVCGEYLSATNLPLFDRLGLGEMFRSLAGPPVSRVGLFVGSSVVSAALPSAAGVAPEWGRALCRERLDTLLLDEAAKAGATIWQPWSAVNLEAAGDEYRCVAESALTRESREFRARVIVAAHGSWESGSLPTHAAREPPSPADLFGFKAHFVNSDLPVGLMPLLSFPGGYGGMVHCDGGRVSLSCCIRRDCLSALRRGTGAEASEAVLQHLRASCLGVRRALAGAENTEGWLATGPIRPGIRVHASGGIFRVGNNAGEAHPVVAEGISMAMQGASLLAEHLIRWRSEGQPAAALPGVGASYAADWRRHFAPRLRVAALVAHWAMHPLAVIGTLPLLGVFPRLLTWGATLSGKTTTVRAGF